MPRKANGRADKHRDDDYGMPGEARCRPAGRSAERDAGRERHADRRDDRSRDRAAPQMPRTATGAGMERRTGAAPG